LKAARSQGFGPGVLRGHRGRRRRTSELGKRPTGLATMLPGPCRRPVGQKRAHARLTRRRSPRTARPPHRPKSLLTAGDFDSRARYLNVRQHHPEACFEWGCLPVINENDTTVSVAEIRFRRQRINRVTSPRWWTEPAPGAPASSLLTNVDGLLFSADPTADPTATLVTNGAGPSTGR